MNNFLLRKTLSTLQTEFIDGNFVRCDTSWNYVNKVRAFNLFYFIINGQCNLKINDKEILAKPGQLVFLPRGCSLSVSLADVESMDKYWCSFNANFGGTNVFEHLKTKLVFDVEDREYIEKLFDDLLIFPGFKNEEAEIIRKNALISLILSYFIEHAGINKNENNQKEYNFDSVINYMKANLSKDISIGDLAKIVNLNSEYFLRLFKKRFGITPAKVLASFRMEMAEKLLIETKMPIADVAREIGINDVKYFSKVFKSCHEGLTPSNFRDNTNYHSSSTLLSKENK